MSTAALVDAQKWAEELQKAEHRGLGDTREAARFRLSRRIGVPESYLARLRYKSEEMSDVAGSVYRALMLAYNDLCVANEKAADDSRTERLKIEERNATAEKHMSTAVGMVAAPKSEEESRL